MALAGQDLLQLVQKSIAQHTWDVLPTEAKIVISRSSENAGMLGAALAACKLLESDGPVAADTPNRAKEDSSLVSVLKDSSREVKPSSNVSSSSSSSSLLLIASCVGIGVGIGFIGSTLIERYFARR